jgi:hypothetical protein
MNPKRTNPPLIALFPKNVNPKFLLFPKRIYLRSNLISQKELTPDQSYFPEGLTLKEILFLKMNSPQIDLIS